MQKHRIKGFIRVNNKIIASSQNSNAHIPYRENIMGTHAQFAAFRYGFMRRCHVMRKKLKSWINFD